METIEKQRNYNYSLSVSLTDLGTVYGFICTGSDGSRFVVSDVSSDIAFVVRIIELFSIDQPKLSQIPDLLEDLLP